MHTSEKLSSFTIENAMLDSSKSSIQHYNRTKQCCFAFIYWSKFIPPFEKDEKFFSHSVKIKAGSRIDFAIRPLPIEIIHLKL